MKQTDLQYEAKTSFFRTLWAKPNKTTSADLIHLYNDCIREQRSISSRTKDYLLFRDPENKFHPSPSTLSEIFLMTYIQRSKQKILLGAHWVWTVLDQPSKNPWSGFFICIYSDIMRMAGMDVVERTPAERMVEFCSSIGRDCYVLFLFFGRQKDEGNINGLLSNNLQAAVGNEMLQAVVGKEGDDPLTMLVKFT
uniref:Sb:cb470 n=1 Tax=Sinocyclocheilus rhinocerous TaxID=307959 RepID=A0A673ISH5_9TELE